MRASSVLAAATRHARWCRRTLTTVEPWLAETVPLASASAPPPSWCTSPAVFEAESEALFPRLWHPVAAAADVAPPGSVAGASVAGQPILVARASADSGLRAFYNTCSHAGALLAPSDNTGRRVADAATPIVTCGYHGWSYRLLDGRLAAAPRMGGAAEFKARDAGLRVAGVAAEWGPLAFVRLGEEKDASLPVPPSVTAALASAGMPTTPAAVAAFTVVARKTFFLKSNWKVSIANYCDGGYHVPVAHPDLAAGLDLGKYERRVLEGGCSLQVVPPAASAPARLAAGTPAAYAYIWPFTFVNRYGHWLDVNLVRPVSEKLTEIHYVWLRSVDAPPADTASLEADIEASTHVQEEDTALCESVQAGLSARGAKGGRYAPRLEAANFAFHQRVAAAYREVGLL